MANLTASQIAAQAAMQHVSSSQHFRKRSQTIPNPHSPPEASIGRRKPPHIQTQSDTERKVSGSGQQTYNGHSAAAATAANAAYPRSQLSPGLTNFERPTEKEHKLKSERSKMKLFSKPLHIGTSSFKDTDRKDRPLPSPNKMGPSGPSGLSKMINPSMTSLADSVSSSTTSLYSSQNASTSTLVPADRQATNEKEKAHRHHFLSRQKNKLKERMDDHALPLSSASSNSKPVDPSAPQPLYSFAPNPPTPTATSFSSLKTGLDLRHGGRALREKKKEEKASAAGLPYDSKKPDIERNDWAISGNQGSSTGYGLLGSTPTQASSNAYGGDPTNLQGFGLQDMSPEDAWDFLKVKILVIFDGGEVRVPVEDLNRLTVVHIQRCVKKRSPRTIMEDLRDFLRTGFLTLNHTLRDVPDSRLVPYLVDRWLFVFGTILPYLQSVFLPLDLEFRGHGSIMSAKEAADFWGDMNTRTDDAFGNELDVRRIVLISYRDNVILRHHLALKSTFSRLSLDSINANVDTPTDTADHVGGRPSTAASLDPKISSFNSQDSTLLGDFDGARSRGNSNTSAPEMSAAPELPSFGSPSMRRQAVPDSAQVTETVARMLQCISVLASVQSGDDAQTKMEGLAKELKLNWLGRGRTGRNRRGFVGTRVRTARPGGSRTGSAREESGGQSML